MRYNIIIGGQEISKTQSLGGLSTGDYWQGGLADGGNAIGHSDDLVIGDSPTVAAVEETAA
jgi:hypothetical protein